jgi:hypothetical protein
MFGVTNAYKRMTSEQVYIIDRPDRGGSVMEPDLSQEQMIQDISEFELGFIDFATVVSMARTVIRQKYRDMSYNELLAAYTKIFGEDYEM